MAAEDALTAAVKSDDPVVIGAAREDVMLAARQAVDTLHHLSDFVLKEPSPELHFASIEDVRRAVISQCRFLRAGDPVNDVKLLQDIADAFKHHRPDRSSATVAASSDVVSVNTGWGELRWSEGKYGGFEQVLVMIKNGDRRALSSVLQNVFDAWMKVLRQPLPPISEY